MSGAGTSAPGEAPPPEREQRTHLAWEPIAEVAAERARLTRQECTETEQAALSGRHVQTVAGFLALKAALIDLLSRVHPGATLARRDIELAHAPDGAPEVRHLPLPLPPGGDGQAPRLFVSITHTKEHAIGVAVLDQQVESP